MKEAECLTCAGIASLATSRSEQVFASKDLWIDDRHWFQEELRKTGLHLQLRATDREEDGASTKRMSRKPKRIHRKPQQEEEEEKEAEDVLTDSNKVHEDLATFIASLKGCAQHKNLHRGSIIHANIVKVGLFDADMLIGSTLVNVYAKCGALEEAQEVFDELLVRNVVSWNVLIAGFAQHGHGERALDCFQKMQHEGLTPDIITLTCILKACGSIGACGKGQEIHAQAAREGLLEVDFVIGSALVDMYAKCGLLGRAQELFDELLIRDMITWNTLITGYAHYGKAEEAFICFERMQQEGFSPNKVTFICILKVCGTIGALNKGQPIHARILEEGLLEKDTVISNALVDMYAKCGAFAKAEQVFDELPIRDVVSWNALIAGYAQSMHGEEAVKYFQRMRDEGFSPDAATFTCILKACGSLGAVDRGQELHVEIVREGFLEEDIVLANALIDMYARCGLLVEAQEVFDGLSVRDVVSWTALITGYVKHAHGERALMCFEGMQREGLAVDKVTYLSVLKACGSIGAAYKGQAIHAEIVKKTSLEIDVVVGTAIVDMYAKCGMLAEAQQVFNELPFQNLILWNALGNGYAQHVRGEETLECFGQMQLEGFSPDSFTFVCVLRACWSIGAAYKGQEMHDEIVKEGLLESCLFAGNALIDMYASCGMVAEAQEVFDKLPVRDVVSWNALIQGYSQLGNTDFVFNLLEKMIGEYEEPDMVTFTILLSACSHGGLLDRGQFYFEIMCTTYGINPILEHQICIIDLFGRAGNLEEVVSVIKKMPFAADITLWHSIMSACRERGDSQLGSWAFQHATDSNERDGAVYVCLSNIHAVTRI